MAASTSSSSSRGQAGQLKTRANQFFVWYTGAILQIYKNFLSGPIARIVPEHTRDAFFQTYCDLRTNVPKDRKWVEQHATALQPRTLLGWLALGSFLAFSGAAGSAILCLASATIATLAYAFIGLVVVAGATAGFWLFVLSGVLFVSSFVIAWLATCAAAGYIFLASTVATFSYIQSRLLSKGDNVSAETGRETSQPKAVISSDSLPKLTTGSKTPLKGEGYGSEAPSLSGGSSITNAVPDVSPGRLHRRPDEITPPAQSISLEDVVSNIANGPNPGKATTAGQTSRIQTPSLRT
jgi:hypothetical protein